MVSCRGSIAVAESALFSRYMLLTTTDIVDDSHGDHLRSLNAAPFCHEQRDGDALRNDKVVELLPSCLLPWMISVGQHTKLLLRYSYWFFY
jgi:hypothetical protein